MSYVYQSSISILASFIYKTTNNTNFLVARIPDAFLLLVHTIDSCTAIGISKLPNFYMSSLCDVYKPCVPQDGYPLTSGYRLASYIQ